MKRNEKIKAALLIAVTTLIYVLFSERLGVARALFDWALLPKESAGNSALLSDKPLPPRGDILDSSGRLLATNRYDYRLSIDPFDLNIEQVREIVGGLSKIEGLEVDEAKLISSIIDSANRWYLILYSRISPEIAESVAEFNQPKLNLEPLFRRDYPEDSLMCHVLGFTVFDNVGVSGVEGYYNSILVGSRTNEMIDVDINDIGREFGLEGKEFQFPVDLHLTIDAEVQRAVEKQLEELLKYYGASSGSIIAMESSSGAIKAMAASPCFSPEYYFEVESQELFYNPLASALHEPGSLLRLITLAIGLDFGVVEPEDTYTDTRQLTTSGLTISNWDGIAHGKVSLIEMLSNDYPIGAATIANKVGPRSFSRYLHSFGFGEYTGIDLLSEDQGIVPMPGDMGWMDSFLTSYSFGQSLAVTPIQLITALSAIVNDGVLVKPYIVESINVNDKPHYRSLQPGTRVISSSTSTKVNRMAIEASSIDQLTEKAIVGLSGQAQIAEPFGYIPEGRLLTFFGWAPASDADIVILVMLEHSDLTSQDALEPISDHSLLINDLFALFQ